MKLLVRRCAGVLVLASAAASAQDRPAFRSTVDIVEVNAVVTDERGASVPNLTDADFRILEDGKPQPIGAFLEVGHHSDKESRAPFAVQSDVRSNDEPTGRIYAIVLDGYHVDRLRTDRVKAAARMFLERALAAGDLAAVVHTADGGSTQLFTSSRLLLVSSIDRFVGRGTRQPMRPARQELESVNPSASASPMDDLNEMERGAHARTSLDALRHLADGISAVDRRRKAIVLFSEGLDYDIERVAAAPVVSDAVQGALDAAARAGVSIYAVDPAEGDGFSLAERSLQVLAEQTGGFAVLKDASFIQAIDRIVADNSSYYVLGYRSANERRDGRFRRIEVRVTRPGVRVRSRMGYVPARDHASDPKATAQPRTAALVEATSSLLPISGIPLSVFAAPLKDTPANAGVLLFLEVSPEYFAGKPAQGAARDTVEVSIAAFDGAGKIKGGKRHTLNLALEARSIEDTKKLGFRIVSQVQVPPGRYQLRIGAADTNDSAVGSVLYDLEVPDFFKAPLSLSGISVYSWPAPPAAPTTGADAPLAAFLPWPPTLRREFTPDDELALFGEAYESPSMSTPHSLEIAASLRDLKGRPVVQDREERLSTEPRGHRGEYGFQLRLPLKNVQPGLYIVHVEARAALMAAPRASRDIPIAIGEVR